MGGNSRTGFPSSPFSPRLPAHPDGPTLPVDPGIPFNPLAPGIPGRPGIPGKPVSPTDPFSPVEKQEILLLSLFDIQGNGCSERLSHFLNITEPVSKRQGQAQTRAAARCVQAPSQGSGCRFVPRNSPPVWAQFHFGIAGVRPVSGSAVATKLSWAVSWQPWDSFLLFQSGSLDGLLEKLGISRQCCRQSLG